MNSGPKLIVDNESWESLAWQQNIWARDYHRLMKTLDEGLAAKEHAAFVEQLAKRRGEGAQAS
jgi:hypothetical protein